MTWWTNDCKGWVVGAACANRFNRGASSCERNSKCVMGDGGVACGQLADVAGRNELARTLDNINVRLLMNCFNNCRRGCARLGKGGARDTACF